ncbi:MAG: TonB-dependent receptor [Verrucomicrobiota bacterium]
MRHINPPRIDAEMLRRVLLAGLGTQLFTVPVLHAQTAPATAGTNAPPATVAAASSEPAELDRVVITGSLIPTSDTIGINPVEVFSATAISETGATDVLGALQKLGVNFTGSGNIGQTLNNGGFGEANIAINNLPTLVLLDGRRLASSSFSNGTAVDVNTLPVSMIERIEVLQDGASTTYGADAVGGVVNIITKKNYNGWELGGRYGFATQDGQFRQWNAYIVGGSSTEKTTVTMGVSYLHQDPLYTKDRNIGSQGIPELLDKGITPPTYFSPSYPGRVGNYVLAGSPFAVGAPGYNPSITSPAVLPGGKKYYSVEDYNAAAIAAGLPQQYVPLADTSAGQLLDSYGVGNYPLLNTTLLGPISVQEQQRLNGFANFGHEIFGKNLEIFGQFLYSQNTSTGALAPSPVPSLGISAITVPADNPFNPFGQDLGAAGSGDPRVRSRFIEVGPRTFVSDTDYFRFVGGLKGQINPDYSWEAAYNYNRSDQTQYTKNAVNGGALGLALQPDYSLAADGSLSKLTDFNGNPIPTYNIFGLPGSNNPQTIDALRTTLYQSGLSQLSSVDGVFTGRPLDLPAGKMAFATGFQYINQTLSLDYDGLTKAGLVPGLSPASPFPGGSLIQWAGFAEVNIPILSPEWSLPGFHSFDIVGAFRYNWIDPGGSDTVPKVGFKWQPIDEQITFRGTYSQGFITPSLYDLYGPTLIGNPTAVVQGVSGQVQTGDASNSNLGPATSVNYTAGVVYTPRQLKELTVSASFYYVKESDFPYRVDATTVGDSLNALGSDSPYAGGFTFDDGGKLTSNRPNQVTIDNWGNANIPLQGGASQKTDGLNLSAQYVLTTDAAGSFTFATSANYTFTYTFQAGPDAPWNQYAGNYTDTQVVAGANGTIPRFQIVPQLTWQNWGLTYVVIAKFVPGVLDQGDNFPNAGGTDNSFTTSGESWHVDSYYNIGMQLSYLFQSKGREEWWNNTTLTVGCDNVTNNQPRLVASSSEDMTDKSVYDIIGRFVYFQVAKKF